MLLRVTTVSSGLKHFNRSLCNTAALCQLHTSNADSVALRKKEEKKSSGYHILLLGGPV